MNSDPNIENKLSKLFKTWSGSYPDKIIQLPHSGSTRIYYRLLFQDISAIGVYNNHIEENKTFLNFTKQLSNNRINVPAIYKQDLNNNIYLIQDLGSTDLLTWLASVRQNNNFPDIAIKTYKKVIQELIQIQVIAGRNFDYSKCYQFAEFNKESIISDLNYFKDTFVDPSPINYHSKKLITDFEIFSEYLLKAESNFFMFRDFQARNILLHEGQLFYIDYQGGRKGPLQYDLVSLLFQAKAQIPEEIKSSLLKYYINLAKQFVPINTEEFTEYYFAFALIRVLQTLGAYGLRGLIEKKQHFIESIPYAIRNLDYLKDKVLVLNQLNELRNIIDQIINNER